MVPPVPIKTVDAGGKKKKTKESQSRPRLSDLKSKLYAQGVAPENEGVRRSGQQASVGTNKKKGVH